MIVRLLLTLLLACLAVPALAMPVLHDMPASAPAHHAMAGMDHGAMPMPGHQAPAHPAMPEHACIGCIPPGADLARAVSPHQFALTPAYPVSHSRLDEGATASPATPPPKPSV